MNRIILAYAPENVTLAESIDHQLSRIGIPFEHANGSLATQIEAAGEPVLLLVTDNFLINRTCLEGLLPVLQPLVADKRLLAVLADGQNAEGEAVPTHIDRMSNALHYMKYWQDKWLALSDHHQHADSADKASLLADLDATRGIANEMGDLISTLREAGYLTWEQFKANEFELFFQKFNLQDWHGQYKRLATQAAEKQQIEESGHLPEMPVVGGLLAPEPVEAPALIIPAAEHGEEEQTLGAMDALLDEMETNPVTTLSESTHEAEKKESGAEKMAARDAWFWIEKGHVQRGLELLQMALEQYPDSEWLKAEYERAARHANLPMAEQQPTIPPNIQTPDSTKRSDEAKSYELMGDMAAERGDYLFAKYCWDRVIEIDPDLPGLYRKLGLLTAEHLRDYRETAVIYLRKAMEINPNDTELKVALEDLSKGEVENETVAAAVVEMADNRNSSEPQEEEKAVEALDISTHQELEAIKTQKSGIPNSSSQLVLITGATSGIGRATAGIFARHGYRLILTGRRVERLVELKNRFESEFGTEVLLLPFDIRDAGAVEAALSNLPESFQDIDILVNNAGLAKGLASIHEGNLDHWETMIDTNVKGLLYVTRLVSAGMVRRRRGYIINVGSSAGKETYPNGNVYCATKFAVDALSKAMRLDLYTHNIRVGQVCPGQVEETEFALTRFDGDAERARIYKDFQPLKSSDVADAIYYMATRPPHVNIQDIQLFATQQANSMMIDRSGR